MDWHQADTCRSRMFLLLLLQEDVTLFERTPGGDTERDEEHPNPLEHLISHACAHAFEVRRRGYSQKEPIDVSPWLFGRGGSGRTGFAGVAGVAGLAPCRIIAQEFWRLHCHLQRHEPHLFPVWSRVEFSV